MNLKTYAALGLCHPEAQLKNPIGNFVVMGFFAKFTPIQIGAQNDRTKSQNQLQKPEAIMETLEITAYCSNLLPERELRLALDKALSHPGIPVGKIQTHPGFAPAPHCNNGRKPVVLFRYSGFTFSKHLQSHVRRALEGETCMKFIIIPQRQEKES